MDGLSIRIHISGRDCILNHEFDFIRPCHFTKAFQRILQKFFGAHPLDIESMLARFDAGQREQVLRKAGHPGRVLADDLQKVAHMIVCNRTVEQRLGVSLDRSQWSTQLMGNVGDEIAAALLHALRLSKIAEHGDGPASRHGRRGDIEDTAGSDGVRTRRSHDLVARRFLNRGEKVRVTYAVDQWRIQPRSSKQQTVHAPIRPLHAPVDIHRNHRVLHAVKKSFQLALAVLNASVTFLHTARRLIEGRRHLPDLVH